MKGNCRILMVLANLDLLDSLQQRNTTIVYYYLTYNLDRKDLVPLINSPATIQILFIIANFLATPAKTSIWVGGCWSPRSLAAAS